MTIEWKQNNGKTDSYNWVGGGWEGEMLEVLESGSEYIDDEHGDLIICIIN